jgi:hypothetical protein
MGRHVSPPRPLDRLLLGLLWANRPRSLIPAWWSRGGVALASRLAALLAKLLASRAEETIPDPVAQGPAILLGRSLKQS